MQQIDRQRAPIQGKLFELESDRPRWQQLPLEVRRTVTELLVLMLSQERRQRSGSAEKEVENE
jgi:hypothetical protein